MANRFLVSLSASWDATNTALWSATSAGAAGATAPTISDDAFVDSSSPGGVLFTVAGAICKSLTWNNAGCTLSLGAAFSTPGAIIGTNGALIDNGYSVTALSYTDANSFALTRSGIWELSGSGTVWSKGASSTITDTGTTKFTNATSAIKTFLGSSKVYSAIRLSGAGSGSFDFSGSNGIANLIIDTLPKNIRLTAGTTTTVNTVTVPVYNAVDVKFTRHNGVSLSVGGGYLNTPDAVANRITGDIDMDCDCVDISVANGPMYAGKGDGVGAGQSWYFEHVTTGLRFGYSVDGTNLLTVNSTVTPYSVGGTRVPVRVKRIAATGVVTFYTWSGSVWVQLGSTVAGTSGALSAGTKSIEIGSWNADTSTAFAFAGDIFRFRLYNGDRDAGGTVVVDFNPNDWTSGNTWPSSTTGETWTRNGSALIYPETSIGSITAAQHTLTKSGGDKIVIPKGRVSRSTATPPDTFFAPGGTDGGNNLGWQFNQPVLRGLMLC